MAKENVYPRPAADITKYPRPACYHDPAGVLQTCDICVDRKGQVIQPKIDKKASYTWKDK